jgi:hypothetical protein
MRWPVVARVLWIWFFLVSLGLGIVFETFSRGLAALAAVDCTEGTQRFVDTCQLPAGYRQMATLAVGISALSLLGLGVNLFVHKRHRIGSKKRDDATPVRDGQQ